MVYTTCSGVYVAHHPWLDTEQGHNTLYKIGSSGNLRQRLQQDAYVTCFTPGWRYVNLIYTRSKRDAQRLEAGIFITLRPWRVRRPSVSELVWRSLEEISLVIPYVAHILNIDILDTPLGRTCYIKPKKERYGRRPLISATERRSLGGVIQVSDKIQVSATDDTQVTQSAILRDYQQDAVKACLQELDKDHRTILQMACRCGKTGVAAKIITHYCSQTANAKIAILVPNLALLGQMPPKLTQFAFFPPVRILLVGSDSRVATTDDHTIRTALACEGPLLVVSTYQSSHLLSDVFDLIIFDECHRICGEHVIRPFSYVVLTFLKGDRFFMTATPYNECPLSMKDVRIFGGIAYSYHLRQGIDAHYVNPFTLTIIGPEPNGIAGQICTAVEQLEHNGKLLVFCRSIAHAIHLCDKVQNLFKGWCMAVHSRLPCAEISKRLTCFQNCKEQAILFNCRLFQEGVEIPALNGVFFASPRHSPRDIIQSLCRPLTVRPYKGQSYVFLPLAFDGSRPLNDASNINDFSLIIPFFDALIAEDPLLFEHLLDPMGVNYSFNCIQSSVGSYNSTQLMAAVHRVIRHGRGKGERLLRSDRIPWDIGYGELKRIVEECGRYPKTVDCFVYKDCKIDFNRFYRYVRSAYQEGGLEPYQINALETLPHWRLYGLHGPYPWELCMSFLETWMVDKGTPPMVEINSGGYVGLDATMMERLSGLLTCINQSDGRRRKGSTKLGVLLNLSKQTILDDFCAKWGLQWRKDRIDGRLVENDKGVYIGQKTFIQKAFIRFKTEWKRNPESTYFSEWFPGYPTKHKFQERIGVDRRSLPPKRRSRELCE